VLRFLNLLFSKRKIRSLLTQKQKNKRAIRQPPVTRYKEEFHMKKLLPMFSVRFSMLLFLLAGVFAQNMQAQCSASISSTNQTVCSGTSVSIPVTLTGVPPYVISYQINGVPLQPVTLTASPFNLVIPSVSQTMAVQLSGVVDGTGCQATGSGTALILVAPEINANFNITHPSCFQPDGAIEAVAFNGTSPFTFAWSTGSTAQTATGLNAGSYSVTITDASGCSQDFLVFLGNISPTFQVNVTPSACNLSNGAINITPSSPSTFSLWSNGATTEDLTNLPAGNYSVTVTESTTGCTNSQNITVPENAPGIHTTSVTPANCTSQTGGVINIGVSGGTTPYSFLWSNGATTQTIGNLAPGTYTVTVTDAAGCTTDFWANVTAVGNVFLNATVQQPTCNDPNGSIDLTVSGGTQPYAFLWSNGGITEDLAGIGSGTYTVTVTEGGGCTRTLSQTLSAFSVSSSATLVNCLNNIHLTVTGGTAPYTYLWSNGETTQDLTGVGAGPYVVTVTDAAGCIKIADVTGVNIAQQTAIISENTNACTGGLSAIMTNVQPNNTSFLWSTGATTRLISNIPAGTYSVTTTANASGCTATASITTTQAFVNSFLVVTPAATPLTCFGGNNGSISVSASGMFPPFTYQWSNGVATQVVNNLSAGIYFVTVTDANGCTVVRGQDVLQPAAIATNWQVTPAICTVNSGAIFLNVTGGTQPYTFTWASGPFTSTTQNLNGIPGGTYKVTIVDANGCTYVSPDVVVPSSVMGVSIETLSTQCNSATLTVNVVGGGPAPFAFSWTGPNGFVSNTQNIIVQFSGTYTVTVTNSTGCTAVASIQIDLPGAGECGYISGKIVRDESADCLADAGEPGLGGWLVRAVNGLQTYYGVSNDQGDYWIGVPEGTYTVETVPPNALWDICLPSPSVALNVAGDTIEGIDLPVKIVYLCPSLSVSLTSGLLRRCNSGIYYIDYCNQGTVDGTDVYVLVTLDPFLTPGSSNRPYTDLGNGVLRFDLGDLPAGDCGYFFLNVQVSCNAVLGQTHCSEAHIYPDGDCVPSNSSWSGASLRVTSQCNTDSVRFIIKNVGSGDMDNTSKYIVVEDAVMLMMSPPFQLASGDSTEVAFPANGSTWRVEVDQVPFHPGLSAPALSVEGCSNTASFSTGYVTQFANNEQDPWIDIDCKQNVGSWDPNDKQGFPIGYGTEHYVRPGTELEYTIRFQNTGTDTAFTVRLADTLSTWLDVATIRPGASSHPYHFNLTGPGYSEFLFENIMLPDSNVNQEASNGFVKFSIYPKADAPLETLIENTAHIYFDQNEAVVTNTTRHRLGEGFVTVGLWQPQRPQYQVLVSPNPFMETARLEVKGLESSAPIHLQVIDLQGKIVIDETTAGPVILLKKGGLPSGMYLFKLDQKGALVGSGKLVVKD